MSWSVETPHYLVSGCVSAINDVNSSIRSNPLQGVYRCILTHNVEGVKRYCFTKRHVYAYHVFQGLQYSKLHPTVITRVVIMPVTMASGTCLTQKVFLPLTFI